MNRPLILVVIPYGFNDRMMSFPEFTISRLLARNGWRVIGLTRREKGEPQNHSLYGIRVFRYQGTVAGIFRALMIFVFSRPDAVHVHMLRNNRLGVICAMLAKLFGIPLAFSEAGLLHDHYLVEDRDDPLGKPLMYKNIIKTFGIRGLRSYFFHWPLTHADRIVFYSKHNIPVATALGIQNVRYVPLIVDESRWETLNKSEIPRALPEGPFALFVGQMKLRKGWDMILRSIPLTDRSAVRTFVFVTSSAKEETSDFAALTNSLGVRDRVLFLGRPSNTLLKQVFDKSVLVIVPSRYEGFGLVPLEAFEMGKPVVASHVEALTDFLEDGVNASLVPPKEPEALAASIMKVMRDATFRERIIQGGHATLARLRSHEYQKQWLDFYRELIA